MDKQTFIDQFVANYVASYFASDSFLSVPPFVSNSEREDKLRRKTTSYSTNLIKIVVENGQEIAEKSWQVMNNEPIKLAGYENVIIIENDDVKSMTQSPNMKWPDCGDVANSEVEKVVVIDNSSSFNRELITNQKLKNEIKKYISGEIRAIVVNNNRLLVEKVSDFSSWIDTFNFNDGGGDNINTALKMLSKEGKIFDITIITDGEINNLNFHDLNSNVRVLTTLRTPVVQCEKNLKRLIFTKFSKI